MSTAKATLIDTNARAGEIFVKVRLCNADPIQGGVDKSHPLISFVAVQEYFYRVYDSSRHEVFRFYREDSVLIWNGNAKKGLQTLRDFFQQLPPSTHNIQSIDCQPIAGAPPAPALAPPRWPRSLPRCTGADGTESPQASNIFVVVVGTVTYAKEDPRHFHETFILAQEPGKGTYYIVNDCFRLTTGPAS